MTDQTAKSIRIHYADSPNVALTVRLIYTWERSGMSGPVMSASSGPKDYIKNQVWEVFESAPRSIRVVAVRANGPMFFLVQMDDRCWFDMAGKQVVQCEAKKH